MKKKRCEINIQCFSQGLKETALNGTEGTTPKENKSLKRRKSSQNPVLNRQFSSGSDKLPARNPSIQKL